MIIEPTIRPDRAEEFFARPDLTQEEADREALGWMSIYEDADSYRPSDLPAFTGMVSEENISEGVRYMSKEALKQYDRWVQSTGRTHFAEEGKVFQKERQKRITTNLDKWQKLFDDKTFESALEEWGMKEEYQENIKRMGNNPYLRENLRRKILLNDLMGQTDVGTQAQVSSGLFKATEFSDEAFNKQAKAWIAEGIFKRDSIQFAYDRAIDMMLNKDVTRDDIMAAYRDQRERSPEGGKAFIDAVTKFDDDYGRIYPLARRLIESAKAEGQRGMFEEKTGPEAPLPGTIARIYKQEGGREKFLYILSNLIERESQEVDQTGVGKFFKSAGRGADSIIGNLGRLFTRKGDQNRLMKTADKEFYANLDQVLRDTKDIESAIAEVKGSNAFSQMMYDAGSSIPYTFMMGNPLGILAGGLSAKEDMTDQIIEQNPGIDPELAERLAIPAAAAYTGSALLGFKALQGKFPGFQAFADRTFKRNLLTRFAGVASYEIAQETFQDATLPLTLDLINTFEQEFPEGDWSEFKLWDTRRSLAVLPMSLLGATAQHSMDKLEEWTKDEEFKQAVTGFMTDEDALMIHGRTKEEADEVIALAKNDPIAALEKFNEQKDDVSPEERLKNGEAAFKEMLEKQIPEEMSDMPYVTRDGMNYKVTYREGGERVVDTPEEAQMLVEDWFKGQASGTQSALKDYIDNLQEVSEGDNTVKMVRPKTLQQLVDEGKEREESARSAIHNYLAQQGQYVNPQDIDLSQYQMSGAVTMRNKMAGFAVEIAQGADPLVVAEEFSEGFIRMLQGRGEITYDRVKELLDEFGDIAGVEMVPGYEQNGDRAVIEAFSQFTKAYLLQGDFDTVPESTKSWFDKVWNVMENRESIPKPLRAVVEFFAKLLQNVYEVAKAIEWHKINGNGINAELETLAQRALGLDENAVMERMREQAQKEILEDLYDPKEELSNKVKGKLPHPDDLKGQPLHGEVQRIYDSMTKETRRVRKDGRRVVSDAKARNFFAKKGEGETDLDKLRQDLNEEGFRFLTPGEMLDAVLDSLEGNPQYPTGLGMDDPTFSISPLTDSQIEEILPGAEYIAPEDVRDAEINGPVIIGAYHGSTHTFDKFTQKQANPENDLGEGIYASTSPEDVSKNYAGEGPDLTSRIEQRKEQLESESYDLEEELTEEELYAQARKELVGEGGRIYPMYFPISNPAVLDEYGGTFYDPEEEIDLSLAEDYREVAKEEIIDEYGIEENELDDYSGEVESRMREMAEADEVITNPLVEAVKTVLERYEDTDVQKALEDLEDIVYEGGQLYQIEDTLRKSEGVAYAMDYDNGQSGLAGHIIHEIFQELGFDGVVDRRANSKFGSERQMGMAMEGMDENTVHLILPIDTENRPRSAFDPETTFSITPAQDAEYLAAVESGDMDTAQEMVDEAAKKAGYDSPKVYHGTASRFEVFETQFNGGHFFSSDIDVAHEYSEGETRKQKSTRVSKMEARQNLQTLIEKAGGSLSPYQERPRMIVHVINDLEVSKEERERLYAELDRYEQEIPDYDGEEIIVSAYLKLRNPYMVDASKFSNWEFVVPLAIGKAIREDHDGVIIQGVIDTATGNEIKADDYVVFDANQIKSADPVTYDEGGNVIPLSERFNEQDDRITYSIRSVEEAAQMKEVNKRLFPDADATKRKLFKGINTMKADWAKVPKGVNPEEMEATATPILAKLDAFYSFLPRELFGDVVAAAENLTEEVANDIVFARDGLRIVDPETQYYSGIRIPLPAWMENFSVVKWVKRNLRARGNLTREQWRIKLAAEAIKLSELKKAELTNRRLQKAVKEEAKTMKGKLPENEDVLMRRVQDALTKDEVSAGVDAIAQLPKSLRGVTEEMRRHVDSMSQKMIRIGLAKGDLAEIFHRNMGSYLNRSYRRFTRPESWKNEVSQEAKDSAKEWLYQNLPAEAFDPNVSIDDQLDGYVDSLLTDDLKGNFTDNMNWLLGQKFLGNFIQRKNVPKELRDLFGEYQRADENYMTTIRKMAEQIGSHSMLKAFRKEGLGTLFFETPRGKFNKQITAAADETLSPLDGLYTTEEMGQALQDFADGPKEVDGWLRWWLKFNSLAKVSKTVYNPTTHARNFLSNFLYTGANGNIAGYFGNGWKSTVLNWKEIFKGWTDMTPEQEAQVQYYVRLGIMQQGAVSQEFKDILKDFSVGEVTFDEYTQGKLKRFAKAGPEKIQAMYQAEDDFHKIVAFEAEKAKLKKAKPKWDDRKIDQEAAQVVRDTMPDYSQVPNLVKGLRRVPLIGTFTSFTSEVIRNSFNIVQRSLYEMRDPDLRAVGGKRMASFLAANALPYFLAKQLMSWFGVDDEEDEAVRAIAPPWDKYSQLYYVGRSESGDPKYINVSYTDPFSIWKTPFQVISKDGLSASSVLKSAYLPLEPFYGKEIGTEAFLEVSQNYIPDSGKKVYNENDSPWKKSTDIATHIGKAVEPGFWRTGERIHRAATGQEMPSGLQLDLGTEIGAVITGQRITTVDRKRAIQFRAGDFRRAKADATRRLSSAWRNREATEEDLKEAYATFQRDQQAAYEDYQDALKAVYRLGLTEEEILLETNEGKTHTKGAKETLSLLEAGDEETPIPQKKFSKIQIKELKEVEGRYEKMKAAAPDMF